MIRSMPHADPPDTDGTPDDSAPTRTRPTASGAAARKRAPRTPEPLTPPVPLDPEYGDPIDQASDDSFPASDPPPWTLGLRRAPVVEDAVEKP